MDWFFDYTATIINNKIIIRRYTITERTEVLEGEENVVNARTSKSDIVIIEPS
jgi:hypothetical protein